jgi:hypothetical protein
MQIGDKVTIKGSVTADVEAVIVDEVWKEGRPCWVVKASGYYGASYFHKIPSVSGKKHYGIGNMQFWLEADGTPIA